MVDHVDQKATANLTRKAFASLQHPETGRRLPGLFAATGLTTITAVPHCWVLPLPLFSSVWQGMIAAPIERGEVDHEEAERWWKELEEAAASGRYLVAVPGFAVRGLRRPEPLVGAGSDVI